MISAAPKRIAILGFGLIGGSVAQALAAARPSVRTESGHTRVVAWSPTGRGAAQALADGVIEAAVPSIGDAIDGADLVILGAPPLETIELIARLGVDGRGRLAAGAVVTDVASSKGLVMAAAARAGLRFVGGHPMAGLEATGYEAARADLFSDRPWVIVPPEPPDPEAVAVVRWLAATCRARPVELGAAEHDAAVAAISHLPLVLSVALVEAVAGASEGGGLDPARELAADLAAGGWASMTRLARGDARMGAGIAATNAVLLAAELRHYRTALDGWISALEAGEGIDAVALEARFRAARTRLLERDQS